MAIKRCATPRHGNTKPLPKSKRDGSEAILTTPGSAMRSDKHATGVGKLHGGLLKPRLNGTLVLLQSGRRTMMQRERTML
jgi:hypothetical protein